MLSDWELWACANDFVRRHGEDAAIHAAMRADELLAEAEFEGAKNFQEIVRRIEQLLERPAGPLN
jgi:hypothetical protein